MAKIKPNRWTRYRLLFEGEHFIFEDEEYRRKNTHFAYKLSTGERVDFRAADKVWVQRHRDSKGFRYIKSDLRKEEASDEQEKTS